MSDPVSAALQWAYEQLTAAPLSGQYGNRVYPYLAPANTPYPYLLTQMNANATPLVRRQNEAAAEVRLLVKCVAATLSSARAAYASAHDRLHGRGFQDQTPYTPALADWQIATTTLERIIHLDDFFDGTVLYQIGGLYLIRLLPL